MPTCPSPLARSLRLKTSPGTRLHVAPPRLQGAVAAIVSRDTRGQELDDAQRLSHFPASPIVCLSWFQDASVGLVERTAQGHLWRPFGSSLVLSGSQSAPTVSWAPTVGRGGMICFTPDVAKHLFDVDWTGVHDRFVPADQVLDTTWHALMDALCAANDDDALLAALDRHLTPRWLAVRERASIVTPLRHLGRHWFERLALQAREWRREQGPRQVERRVKAMSGRSLRAWGALVKSEGAFFTARDLHESGLPIDWAGLAQDEGYVDQSHLSRAARRITGFPPGEFVRRYAEDESFWLYRLWI